MTRPNGKHTAEPWRGDLFWLIEQVGRLAHRSKRTGGECWWSQECGRYLVMFSPYDTFAKALSPCPSLGDKAVLP